MRSQRVLFVYLLVLVFTFTCFIAQGKGDRDKNHKYWHIGCYLDRGDPYRAMPDYLEKWQWEYQKAAIIGWCADEALSRSYDAFGVQNGGECWSGPYARLTYDKYGNVHKCKDGLGGNRANDVYFLRISRKPKPRHRLNNSRFNVSTPCPVNTYKHNHRHIGRRNNTSCHKCPGRKTTCGKTGATTARNCTVDCPSGPVDENVSCQICPVNRYENGSKCVDCQKGSQTWGRKGVSSVKGCTANNPIKISNAVRYESPNTLFNPGNVIAHFNASYKSGSLVIAPLIYTITRVTFVVTAWIGRNSDGDSDITSQDVDFCNQLKNNNSSSSFCIYKYNGTIVTNHHFNCSYMEKVVIQVNVSDSGNDTVGSIVNPEGNVTIVCRKKLQCPGVKESYDAASKACLTAANKLTLHTNGAKQVIFNSENISSIYKIHLKGISREFSLQVCNYSLILKFNKSTATLVNFTLRKNQTNITMPLDSPIDVEGSDNLTIKILRHGNFTYSAVKTVTLFIVLKRNCFDNVKCLNAVDHWIKLNKTRCGGDPANLRMRYEHCLAPTPSATPATTPTTTEQEPNTPSTTPATTPTTTTLKPNIPSTTPATTPTTTEQELNCNLEQTGDKGTKGVFEWTTTKTNNKKSVLCPYGPGGSNATRYCSKKSDKRALWDPPDDEACNYKSSTTNVLQTLFKTKIDRENCKEVAKNLTKLFEKGKMADKSKYDAILAAEVVRDIVAIEDKLNETADEVVEVIDSIMEMNRTTLAASENASAKIIEALAKIAEHIPMVGNATSRLIKGTNIILQANEVNRNSFKGIAFGIGEDGFIATNAQQSRTSVTLPQSILNKASARIGFTYYANNKLFQLEPEVEDQEDIGTPSDEVLSSSVYNTSTSNLSNPVILRFTKPEDKEESSGNTTCVFWVEEERRWSDFGCRLCSPKSASGNSVECCCNHMTSFAVLFSFEDRKPSKKDAVHAKILSIITYVGCGISLAGVTLTFLTYSLFRHLRKTNQQPILMNICVAIALLLIVFIVGINRTDNLLGCQTVAVLLHYLTLVTVLWMGIEAYNLYLHIVKVMAIYTRKFMLKAAIVGWGMPAIIVATTVVVAYIKSDAKNDSSMFYYGNNHICILHKKLYMIIAWFAPVLAILFYNLCMSVLVIYKLTCTGVMVPTDSKSNHRKQCWTALAIISLLGVTWLFGAMAISDARIVFEYLFCIFNSLQGFFIFFFHCVRIKEVRNQWSFFVSGLGFSHKESENSRPRSRGIGESQHSSETPGVKFVNWIRRSECEQPTRKETMLTIVNGDSIAKEAGYNDNPVDIQLDEFNDPTNDMDEGFDEK